MIVNNYNEFYNWLKNTYPKLYEYILESTYNITRFCEEHGCSESFLSNYDVEQRFIEDNKHMHTMWMI